MYDADKFAFPAREDNRHTTTRLIRTDLPPKRVFLLNKKVKDNYIWFP